MKLSQVSEAKYYRGRISADRVADLYWNMINDTTDDSFVRFHPPRLYGGIGASANRIEIDAFLRIENSSQAIQFVKDYIQKLNLPYTSLDVEKTQYDARSDLNARIGQYYVVTITFEED